MDAPPVLWLNDIMPILPPEQIWPFQKLGGADWYLIEKGIDGTGVGFMWGVVTQGMIGFDYIELALRGIFLGYVLAKIHGWYQTRQNGFLETLFYIVLCSYVLATFRDTTGALFWGIFWEFLPFYVILRVLCGREIITGRNDLAVV